MLYTQQGFGVICDMQDGWETITFLGQEQQNLQTLPKRPKKKVVPVDLSPVTFNAVFQNDIVGFWKM